MSDVVRLHLDDWSIATTICRKYPNMKCLEATAELMNYFRERAEVIFACTLEVALRPFIVHVSLPNDIISETGQHWAVMLHGKVFDNLHPEGEQLEKWMLNFEFATKNWGDGHFSEEILERWTYKEFVRYLRKCRRTLLGIPKGT